MQIGATLFLTCFSGTSYPNISFILGVWLVHFTDIILCRYVFEVDIHFKYQRQYGYVFEMYRLLTPIGQGLHLNHFELVIRGATVLSTPTLMHIVKSISFVAPCNVEICPCPLQIHLQCLVYMKCTVHFTYKRHCRNVFELNSTLTVDMQHKLEKKCFFFSNQNLTFISHNLSF